MTEHRDDDLEEIMRAGLHGKAEEVENHGGYAARARLGARTRRRTRIGLVAAATAAVIVAGVVATDLVDDPGVENAPVAGPTQTGKDSEDPGSGPQVPANWRVESYRGVQLRVPPDWGWGGAPRRDSSFGDGLVFCGPGAHAYPGDDGETRFEEAVDRPYVGRADYTLTDVCMGDWSDSPSHPWVWFGAPVDVGTVELPNGFVQRTVEVAGVRVTVGHDDADELATILASVEAVGAEDANGCEPLTTLPRSGDGLNEIKSVESVAVCAYRQREAGDVALGYSTMISGPNAQHVFELIRDTPGSVIDCDPDAGLHIDDVLLRFAGPGGSADVLTRIVGCAGYYTGDEGVRFLTRANVTPWVVDAIGLYVSDGSAGKGLTGMFHPVPG